MRRALATLAILAVFALGTSSTFAARPVHAGPGPLALVTDWYQIACNVEQQTFNVYGDFNINDPCPGPTVVNNPTGCMWDYDDAWSKRGIGSIARGAVVTASLCAIADGSHTAPVDAWVGANHNKLIVRLNASDGRTWLALPVSIQGGYEYPICADNFMYGPHPEVPDSNGGHGTLITYTLTVDATLRGANAIEGLLTYGQGIWTVGACL